MDVQESELACPRCQEPLATASGPDVTLHGCATCGGIWLSEEDSRKAIDGLASPTVEMVEAARQNATRTPDLSGWLPCPECSERMERNRFEPARVDIDFCQGHGTWFDAGELLAVHQSAMGTLPAPALAPDAVLYDDDDLPAQTSGMAVAGLALSFVCSIVGLIVSFIALNEIKNSGGRLKGEGLAIAGIIVSVVFMMLACLIRLPSR